MTPEKTGPAQADFSFVRYSNCWEDSRLLSKVVHNFPACKEATALSICSAGDNTLHLGAQGFKKIIAFDINPTQLALLALRIAALRTLKYEEVLQFLGYRPCSERMDFFTPVLRALTQPYAAFWKRSAKLIPPGVIHCGKFERYFALFRTLLVPWIHSANTVHTLCQQHDPQMQRHFYYTHWNSWRWKLFFALFFSRTVLGFKGRDRAFFTYVKGSVSRQVHSRIQRGLETIPTASNPYLSYILQGQFTHALPQYLMPQTYPQVCAGLDTINLFEGSVDQLLQTTPPDTVGLANLSDIFEYLPEHAAQKTAQLLYSACRPRGVLCYWNMLVPRVISTCTENLFCRDTALSSDLLAQDRAYFYRDFIVENRCE